VELFPSQEAEDAPGGNAFLSLSLFSNHRFYSASVVCSVLGREVLMRDLGVAICENKGSTTFWVAYTELFVRISGEPSGLVVLT
jgi:hypothetical protein